MVDKMRDAKLNTRGEAIKSFVKKPNAQTSSIFLLKFCWLNFSAMCEFVINCIFNKFVSSFQDTKSFWKRH